MKFKLHKKHELKTNLIPLINVIFIILIFFLVLYRFSTVDFTNKEDREDREDNLLNGTSELSNNIILEINANGRLFINGLTEISNKIIPLKDIIDNPEETSCLIMMDKEAPYKTFSKLVLNLKRIGVTNITFKEK